MFWALNFIILNVRDYAKLHGCIIAESENPCNLGERTER